MMRGKFLERTVKDGMIEIDDVFYRPPVQVNDGAKYFFLVSVDVDGKVIRVQGVHMKDDEADWKEWMAVEKCSSGAIET